MSKRGLQKGKTYYVVVIEGDEVLGTIEHTVLTNHEVLTSVNCDEGAGLLVLHEALGAATSAVDFHLHKPDLSKLVAERIEELKAAREEVERKPLYPDDVPDIPF